MYQPDKATLDNLVAEHYISRAKHPEANLWIYNYTPKTVYKRYWTPDTRACRGLILDADYNVVARPFEKFFNIGEEQYVQLPDEPCHVYEKLDGSLGILYHDGKDWAIATRGSFNSEQAIAATRLLHSDAYRVDLGRLNPKDGMTYLFEIILPWNRIVVDYGDIEELRLIGIIETATGEEMSLLGMQWPSRATYYGERRDLLELCQQDIPNAEGYVLLYQSGLRVKIKFDTYYKLHKLLTRASTKVLWEWAQEGMNPRHVSSWYMAPEEFRDWATGIYEEILEGYTDIEEDYKRIFKNIINDTQAPAKEDPTYRKWFATRATQYGYCSILFNMLDERDYSSIIWKAVKPVHSYAFKVVDTE